MPDEGERIKRWQVGEPGFDARREYVTYADHLRALEAAESALREINDAANLIGPGQPSQRAERLSKIREILARSILPPEKESKPTAHPEATDGGTVF